MFESPSLRRSALVRNMRSGCPPRYFAPRVRGPFGERLDGHHFGERAPERGVRARSRCQGGRGWGHNGRQTGVIHDLFWPFMCGLHPYNRFVDPTFSYERCRVLRKIYVRHKKKRHQCASDKKQISTNRHYRSSFTRKMKEYQLTRVQGLIRSEALEGFRVSGWTLRPSVLGVSSQASPQFSYLLTSSEGYGTACGPSP